MVSNEPGVPRLSPAFGSSRFTHPAYQEGSTYGATDSRKRPVHVTQRASRTYSEFESWARGLPPSNHQSLSLPHATLLSAPQLSLGTFWREPATRRFDESFAPTHKSAERFARQNPFGPPPGFPPASSCSCVGHRHSGLRTTALTPDPTPAAARAVKPDRCEGMRGGPCCGSGRQAPQAVARVAFAARIGD